MPCTRVDEEMKERNRSSLSLALNFLFVAKIAVLVLTRIDVWEECSYREERRRTSASGKIVDRERKIGKIGRRCSGFARNSNDYLHCSNSHSFIRFIVVPATIVRVDTSDQCVSDRRTTLTSSSAFDIYDSIR